MTAGDASYRSECASCMDTGWVQRVKACPCLAPESATGVQRLERYANAIHDRACDDGWVYSRTACECDGAQEKRQR